jgi:NADH-quinone oxidoreductase subunit E
MSSEVAVDIGKTESVINKYNSEKRWLISILLDIQSEYNYLPKDALGIVANKLKIPLIDVYSVATFYKVFDLKPRGKHLINVCLGTACHVRGSQSVVDEVKRKLSINVGETTEDKQFTLETVRCLGCCAMGPVVVVDNDYYSNMTSKKTDVILNKYKKEENT